QSARPLRRRAPKETSESGMRWNVKTISTWENSSRPFKQSGANLDESSSIREVTPPHTSSTGSRIRLWTIPTGVKVKCEGMLRLYLERCAKIAKINLDK